MQLIFDFQFHEHENFAFMIKTTLCNLRIIIYTEFYVYLRWFLLIDLASFGKNFTGNRTNLSLRLKHEMTLLIYLHTKQKHITNITLLVLVFFLFELSILLIHTSRAHTLCS